MSESFKAGDKTLLAAIPKLYSISQFSTWRLAFETYALATGCRGNLDGTTSEPGLSDITNVLAAGRPVQPAATGDGNSGADGADATPAARRAADRARAEFEASVQSYEAAEAEQRRRLLRAGTEAPQGLEATTKKEWDEWAKKEGHMQGALRGTVSAGILVDIKDLRSAKDMWDLLYATHPIDTAENRAAIRRDLSMITLTDTSPRGMEKHLEHFNSIVLRSQEAGNPIAASARAQMFADTFPHQLENLRTLWGISSPLLDETKMWHTLLRFYNEEIDRRRRVQTTNTAMATTNGRSQQHSGQPKRDNRVEGGKDKRRPEGGQQDRGRQGMRETRTCYSCGKPGHLQRDCRTKRRQYGKEQNDRWNQQPSGTNYDDQHQAMVATAQAIPGTRKWMWDEEYYSRNIAAGKVRPGLAADVQTPETPNVKTKSLTSGPATAKETDREALAVSMPLQEKPDTRGWLVDSGATNHLTPTRALLTNIKRCDPPIDFGTAASKGSMTATEYGQATIELDNGQLATLFPVYLVPKARLNLLSVSSATSKGWGITLCDTMGHLYKGNRRLTFARNDNHWYIPPNRMQFEALAATGPTAAMTRSKLEEEHQRLGHIGRPKLLELAKADQLQYSWNDLQDDNFRSSDCPTCQSWKATRPPKNDSPKHPQQQGMLLHIDITGPFDPSRRMNRWLVVIVDDYSDATEVIPTRTKAEAFTALRDTATYWSRQFGNEVRVIRSDGDTVFQSDEAKLWYRQQGIRHHVTPRYTPELNGKAERTIRTIKDGIRSMLGGSTLGHAYWDYAAQYFAVIHNKTTTIPDTKDTVWETLTMRHPNLHTVRQFGEINYVQLPAATRQKNTFDRENAMRCRILGQDPDVSGWIVLVDSTNEVVRSRDVKRLTKSLDGSHSQFPQFTRIESSLSNEEEMDDTAGLSGAGGGGVEEEVHDADVGQEEEISTMEQEEAENGPDPLSAVSGDVFRASEPALIPPTPITFERVEVPFRPGYDEVSQRYIDKTGIIVTEELIDELKSRQRQKTPLTDEEKGLLNRWKHHQLIKTTGPREVAEPEELGRGHRQRWFGTNTRNAFLASESVLVLTTTTRNQDPFNYKQATSAANYGLWQPAITKELDNLRAKKVFRPSKLPRGRRAITCRWIFTTKRDADGAVTKRKARLVARGFSQQPGIDFEETFAPVSRLVSFRIFLTLAASLDWDIHQADVEGAYLNGKIKEEIYMEVPPGYKVPGGYDCVRVDGALYGLKQAAQCWWEEVQRILRSLGFRRLQSEWGLYYRDGRGGPITVLVYVDDFLITAYNRSTIDDTLAQLRRHWTITDTKVVTSILGMKVERDRQRRTITVTQPGYIDTLLARFPLTTNRDFVTPLPTSFDNLSNEAFELTPYQQIIGSLMWISGSTRPDVAYAVNYLARYNSAPTEGHWQQALRVVSYLGSTRHVGLTLGGKDGYDNGIRLEGWVDADWGGCLETRRSTTGYAFKLNGSLIAWSARRQQTVASSTLHAEYVALSEAVREAAWLRTVLQELNFTQRKPTKLHCDNQGAMCLAKNPATHTRTKHIDIRHHIIREMVDNGVISLEYIKTADQIADIFTKPLPGPRHLELVDLMGMSGTNNEKKTAKIPKAVPAEQVQRKKEQHDKLIKKKGLKIQSKWKRSELLTPKLKQILSTPNPHCRKGNATTSSG